MNGDRGGASYPQDIIDAFVRLASGDFSVRLARTETGAAEDVVAYAVNTLAEELERLFAEQAQKQAALERAVASVTEVLVAQAAGNFAARASRTGAGDPLDLLAFLVNGTTEELGRLFDRVEAQAREMETILRCMSDGVVLLDPAGTVVRTNRALEELLGAPRGALRGEPVAAILAADPAGVAALLESAAAGTLQGADVPFRTASGGLLPLVVTGSVARDAAGAVQGTVLVVRDERELRRARAQLHITERMTAVGAIAAGVAHEINNPLCFVSGNVDHVRMELQVLAARPDAPPVAPLVEALTDARDGARRVATIVHELKAFSRIDDVTSPVDVNQLVRSAVKLLANEIRHVARLTLDLGDAPHVAANEGRLGQTLLNLIHNAVQAIPEGHPDEHEIAVTTSRGADGATVVEVRDTGVGIEPEALGRIFDPFYTTKATRRGTGMGLAICHSIVAQLGGRIDVTSRPGAGSTFRVLLPAGEQAPEAQPAPAATGTGRGRVLVIDDEHALLRTVRRVLEPRFEVTQALGGEAALEALAEQRFDAVLCDVMMPGMSGADVFEHIRAHHPDLAPRVAFLTGGAFTASMQAYLEQTACMRIDKPFDPGALRAAVEALMAPDGAGGPEPLP